MKIEEKLRSFKDRVVSYQKFDENFARLIGIELYGYIQSEKSLKEEFDKRVNYLHNLVSDEKCIALQDSLFSATQKLLELVSMEEAQKRQSEWDKVSGGPNAMGNCLKNLTNSQTGRINDEYVFLTLPQLYLALQDKKNYYRLGDRGGRLQPKEISRLIKLSPVRDQYEMNVDEFIKMVIFPKFAVESDKEKSRLDSLLGEYNGYWYELDELTYTKPVELHIQNFEAFFFSCVEFHPRAGYEHWHDLYKHLHKRDGKQFEEVKHNAYIVIDDLMEILKSQDNPSVSKVGLGHVREPIELKKLNISINGGIISKGDNKFHLNPTDEGVVYFLYLKSTGESDECFNTKILSKELEVSEGTIKNSISKINQGVRNLITSGRTNIGSLIKSEPRRGYHLNRKFL